MSDSEMTWDVDKSVADVWLTVHHAVFDAVDEAVNWAVDRTVRRAVNDAVYWDVDDATHPAIQDFLWDAGFGS